MRHGGFHVLVVCTANLCRSPLAEQLLAHALVARDLPWSVSSAGTNAVAGTPAHPHVRTVLSERGIDQPEWRTTRTSAQLVDRADLVLVAEAANRSSVVQLNPRALHSTFLTRQFEALASTLEIGSVPFRPMPGPTLVAACRNARGHLQPGPSDQYDIPDPIGQPLRAFRECADLIQTAIDKILAPIGR